MNPLATSLRELRDIRSSGANVPETSFYGPLANLLALKPCARCIITPKNQGTGIPDGGFCAAGQLPRQVGQPPSLPGSSSLLSGQQPDSMCQRR